MKTFPFQGVKERARRQDGSNGSDGKDSIGTDANGNSEGATAGGSNGKFNGGVGGDAVAGSGQPGSKGGSGQQICACRCEAI